MNLRQQQLECFLAVVDYGTVTRAAAVLHLAQPSLSQTIRKLERDLGAELFHRVGRGLVLTAAGDALVGPARQATRDLSLLRDVARGYSGLSGGRLDIVCAPWMARDFVSEWIGALRRPHPGVRVRLDMLEDSTTIADRVRGGDYELGFTSSMISREGLQTRQLARQLTAVALPPGTGADLPEPMPLEELARVPLVVVRPRSGKSADVIDQLAEHGLHPTVVVEVNDDTPLVPLVTSGAGAALLPMRLAIEARRRGATVRSTAPTLSRPLSLLHRDSKLSPAAQALVDLGERNLQRWYAAVDKRSGPDRSPLEVALETDNRIVAAYARNAVPIDPRPPDAPASDTRTRRLEPLTPTTPIDS